MAETGRRADIIDIFTATGNLGGLVGFQERLRKLEVLGNPRTLVPKMWVPEFYTSELAAELCTLMGSWRRIGGTFQYADGHNSLPVASPAAHFCYDRLLQEGFGSTVACQQWTKFLWHMRSLPIPLWLGDVSFDASDENEAPMAMWKAAWDDPSHHHPMHRTWYFAGMPARGGPWNWLHYHDTWSGGLNNFPGDEQSLVGDPIDADLNSIITPGGWGSGLDPIEHGIVFRDNTYGFTAHDCGGPNEPPYTSWNQPGNPFIYNSGFNPCPGAPIGTVFFGGSILRVVTWLPTYDIYLRYPPVPTPDDALHPGFPTSGTGGEEELLFGYPGMPQMISRAALYAPYYPAVQDFLARTIPAAQALYDTAAYRHWQPFDLVVPWTGHIEAQRSQDKVILRGFATWDSTGPIDTQQIALMRTANLGQPTWLSGLSSARLLVHTTHPLYPLTHCTYNVVTGSFGAPPDLPTWYRLDWTPDTIIGGSLNGPITLYFDGLTFPVRPGS